MVTQDPSKFGVKWTDAEKTQLRRLWFQGVAIKQIAFDLNKTIPAVKHQRIALGLPSRYDQTKTNMLRVNVSPQLHRKVSALAMGRRQTVSEYIRNLIMRDVGEHRG